ncbi:MAG TPA: PAS domain S-box protein [Desulfuromonadaceae bacterium]|jgi:PAS domain S-box-containing protein
MKNFAKMTKAELISELKQLLSEDRVSTRETDIVFDAIEKYAGERQATPPPTRGQDLVPDPYDSAPFGYITLNHSGIISEINQTGALMFGKERHLLIGSAFRDIIGESYLEKYNLHINQCRQTGLATSEMHLKSQDCNEFIAHVCSMQYMDFTKQQIFYRTTISDISKMKTAEESRQKNQKLLQAIIEGTSDAIYAKDVKGRYLLFNSAAASAAGKNPEDVIGKDDYYLYSPKEAEKVAERDRAIILAGKSMTFEETVPGATTGEWITFNTTKGPLFDENGCIIGQFGIARNITEQKSAEVLLQESRQRLKDSEDRLRLATESAGLGTFDYYPKTGEFIWSDLTKQHFGLPPETPINFNVFLAGIHSEDRLRIKQLVNDIFKSECSGEFEAEFRTIGIQDHKEKWLTARGKAFFDEEGRAIRFIGTILDITEAKQNKAEIERLASFPQLDPNPIIELDMSGKIIYCNSAAARFKKKIRSNNLNIFIPPNFKNILFAMKGEKQFVFYQEITVREQHFGEYIHLVPHLQVIRIYATDITARKQAQKALQQAYAELELRVMERTTKLAGAVNALQKEIVERKRMEAALKKSAEVIEDLYNNAPCGYHSLDKDGNILRINATELKWLGYTYDEVVGKKLTDFMPNKGKQTFEASYPKFMQEGYLNDLNQELVRKDGSIIPVSLSATAIYSKEGEYVMSRSIAFNISERKEAEKKLLRLNHLYAVLSAIDKAIVHSNSHEELFQEVCRITIENGEFRLAWIGLIRKADEKQQIVASHGETSYLEELLIIPPNDAKKGKGSSAFALRTEDLYICNDFLHDPATTPRHENARLHHLKASASIALKMKNKVIGTLNLYASETGFFDSQLIDLIQQMAADISFALENFERDERRKKAEKALQAEINERLRTMEELRQKDRIMMQQSRLAAMGEMVGNIAHQWRQPLNTLGLIVQRLPFFYEAGGFNKEFLDGSTSEAMNLIQHMSKTIDDFRGFFKTDKERITFELNKVIQQTVSLIEGSVKDEQITISVNCEENLHIYGYPNEYSQVILCILHNARDVILERGLEKAQVDINSFVEDEKVVVTVTDNAGGISSDVIDKIFDPYFTTKSPDKGTGVGLFMAKKIIEESMAGRLLAYNTGTGAEFRIEV